MIMVLLAFAGGNLLSDSHLSDVDFAGLVEEGQSGTPSDGLPCFVPITPLETVVARVILPTDASRLEAFSAVGLKPGRWEVDAVSVLACGSGNALAATNPDLISPFWNGINWQNELRPVLTPFTLVRYRLNLAYGLSTHVISLRPVGVPPCAIILHGGHGGVADGIEHLSDVLMSNICWIVFVEMPAQANAPYYEQSSQIATIGDVELNLADSGGVLHNNFEKLEDLTSDSALPIFLLPSLLTVDLISSSSPTTPILMTGLSGGGWSTHIASALDPRIRFSVAVAGSVPNQGSDFEQTHPALVGLGWPFIYALSANPPGREAYHVLAFDDPCCFDQAYPTDWIADVRKELDEMGGGSYQVVLIHNFESHAFGTVSTGLIRDLVGTMMEMEFHNSP